MRNKIDPAVATSVAEVVRAIEGSSSAELVVEVRSRSGSYAHADARLAALVSFLTLLFVLFSPWTFEPPWVAAYLVIAYLAGMVVSRSSDIVRRLMTTRSDRQGRVRTIAAATFFERGVANTQRETGLLVYVSILERRIELLADRGVLDAVPVLAWNQLAENTRTLKATAADLPDVLRALQPLLARHLPARLGDRDELPNEARFVNE